MIDLVRPRVECSREAGGQAAGSLRSRIVCSLGVGDDGPTRGRSEVLAGGWAPLNGSGRVSDRDTPAQRELVRTNVGARTTARRGSERLSPERLAETSHLEAPRPGSP